MTDFLSYAILGINIVTFVVYGIDKVLAARGKSRISEFHLLILAALIGFFGAWLAVILRRHKSKKRSFQGKLLLATLVNVLWFWLVFRLRSSS